MFIGIAIPVWVASAQIKINICINDVTAVLGTSRRFKSNITVNLDCALVAGIDSGCWITSYIKGNRGINCYPTGNIYLTIWESSDTGICCIN